MAMGILAVFDMAGVDVGVNVHRANAERYPPDPAYYQADVALHAAGRLGQKTGKGFYDQIEPGPRVCDGTACHFEGGRTLEAHLARCGPLGAVRCLGHCYGAPAFQTGAAVFARPRDESLESWLAGWGEEGSPAPDLLPIRRRSLAEVPVVLRHLLRGAATQTFDEYELPDGEAILRALEAASRAPKDSSPGRRPSRGRCCSRCSRSRRRAWPPAR
jgi:hypothetical protein